MTKIYVPGVLFSFFLIVTYFSPITRICFAATRSQLQQTFSKDLVLDFFPLSEDTSQVISSEGLGAVVIKGNIVEQARLDNPLDADKEE